MTIPIRNVYYLLCYATTEIEELDLVGRDALDQFEHVQDLYGKILAEGTFRILRRGVHKGYRETTEEIPGVRGKLELAGMARTAVRSRGRTICTFEEYTPDVLQNQILRSTLGLLLKNRRLDRSVRSEISLAHRRLEGVSEIPLGLWAFRKVQLNASQRAYRFLLDVCRLALETHLVDETTGEARFLDVRKDTRRMWQLFESFVREFYRVEQSGFRVSDTRALSWFAAHGKTPADQAMLPGMAADVLLDSSDRRIILDTKFYGSPLSYWHGTRKLRSGNLYQMLNYLENRQGTHPDGPRHEGMLLYAAAGESFATELSVRGFRVLARTVDLSRDWQEIRGEMLSALELQ